jgi:hypothetical protein
MQITLGSLNGGKGKLKGYEQRSSGLQGQLNFYFEVHSENLCVSVDSCGNRKEKCFYVLIFLLA